MAEHVELQLHGFTIGIATTGAANKHGLSPNGEGRSIKIALWTDDVDLALTEFLAEGVRVISPAHDFLGGALRSAWISDPDGNPLQLVQRMR